MSFHAVQLDALSKELAIQSAPEGMDSTRARAQRRATGAFFTPMPLVRFVVEEALDAWFAEHEVSWHESGAPEIRILDPAAGDGRFLACAAQSLLRRARAAAPRAAGTSRKALELAIKKHCLVAIERDKDYAASIKDSLGEELEVHCQEALLSGVVVDGSIDLVIGNPPYLRSIQLGLVDAELRERLRGAYVATSYREWDLYAAFLEQGLRWLRPGGQLAFVLPSRWWTAQWAKPMRRELCEHGAVRALVDFGAAQIFKSATVYSSICFASSTASKSLRVARYQQDGWQTGAIATSELGAEGGPWNLCVGPKRALLRGLCSKGPALGEVARIAKGTGTNADSVFVICDANTQIESELLRPLLRGRDVAPWSEAAPWPKLLVPYTSEGALVEPGEMASHYPNAWSHLQAHRPTLESREQGRFAGDTFYCFGRPQNMAFHSAAAAKLVVPDVTKEGRAMIDTQSAMVLDSAYALRCHPGAGYDLASLCAILNSKIVMLWLSQHGLPLRGGYTRMKTAYLRGLPLPPRGDALDTLSSAAGKGATAEELDQLVRLAYGVESAAW